MKLYKLPSEDDRFRTYPVEFCGESCYLIVPQIDTKWTKHNLHFRSLIVRGSDFEVMSSGLKKFFNVDEKPDAYPDPEHFRDWRVETKKDGSLVICDHYNGQFSMRTRGTPSYTTQENAADFEQLLVQYPLVLEAAKNNQDLSLLFEIMTPNNVIVIPVSEVQFTFLGAIDKHTLEMLPFGDFQQLGWMMEVPMPQIHKFTSLVEMIDVVKEWKGEEGVVLSYNQNQNRVKIKADEYLVKHRLKSELNSENNFVEFYVHEGMPEYNEFFAAVERVVDFETATAFRGRISKVVDAGKEVRRILDHMDKFVDSLRKMSTRKEQAEMIVGAYGPTNRASFCFAKLDGKEMTKDQITKLFWQIMK